MLRLTLTDPDGHADHLWHWNPPNLTTHHWTAPEMLVTNPFEVLTAVAAFCLRVGYWRAEGWALLTFEDIFRNRIIWTVPLTEIPQDDTLLTWVIHRTQDYAADQAGH